jgi:glutaredoxin
MPLVSSVGERMEEMSVNKRTLLILLGLLLFLLHDVSADEWYRWVDSEGRTIISRKPPPKGTRELSRQTLPQRETHSTEVRRSEPSRSPQVELYITSWCPACQKARAYLQRRGIPFKAYDVEKDPGAARRKKMIDPREGVPLAVINGQKILGFSAGAYQRALAANP